MGKTHYFLRLQHINTGKTFWQKGLRLFFKFKSNCIGAWWIFFLSLFIPQSTVGFHFVSAVTMFSDITMHYLVNSVSDFEQWVWTLWHYSLNHFRPCVCVCWPLECGEISHTIKPCVFFYTQTAQSVSLLMTAKTFTNVVKGVQVHVNKS